MWLLSRQTFAMHTALVPQPYVALGQATAGMHTCVCGGAGQQQNAPTASAAASEASSAPDAVEQTAETPVEGKSPIPT